MIYTVIFFTVTIVIIVGNNDENTKNTGQYNQYTTLTCKHNILVINIQIL